MFLKIVRADNIRCNLNLQYLCKEKLIKKVMLIQIFSHYLETGICHTEGEII